MSDCKLICAIKDNVKNAFSIPGDAVNDNIKKKEIKEIIIPNGLKAIRGSFSGWGFETITIPSSVEIIGMDAFKACPNLKKIEVAKGNNKICMQGSAFESCPNLEKIEVAKGNNKICMEMYAFAFCPNLKNLSIYSNDAIIGSRAFEGCKKLETVVIKGANADICRHAFINCENLKTVIIKGANVNIQSDAFEDCKNLKTLSIPENAEVAKGAFRNCDKVPYKYKK